MLLSQKINFRIFTSSAAIICYLCAAKILFHLCNLEYGYHRDELYYLVISRNFSFQNLDMLPLSPLYLKCITAIFGTSLKALHFASALCGMMSLVFTCLIAKELKGGKYAIFLAGVCSLFSGSIVFGALFSYDSMDFLLIVAALYVLVKIFNSGNQKWWLAFGIVMGLGLSNKLTILFFGLAVFLSLWIVPQRKLFREKWIWMAGIIALMFLVPYAVWQSRNGWYFLDFAQNYAGGYSYVASLPEFIWYQLVGNNFPNAPIWLLGLWLLLFSKDWAAFRFFGVVYVVLFLIFYLVGAKFYFLIPVYSLLIAVGSVKLEQVIMNARVSSVKRNGLRYGLPVAYVILTLPTLFFALPLLPVETFIRLAHYISKDAGVKTDYAQTRQLPTHFADRFGWEEMTRKLSDVYQTVPADQRGNVGIMTENWGEASAVNFFREKYSLPEATCPDGWYYYETQRKKDLKDMYITLNIRQSRLAEVFDSIASEGVFTNEYCVNHENNAPVFLCSFPKFDLRKNWSVLHHVDEHLLILLKAGRVDSAAACFREQRGRDSTVLLCTKGYIDYLGYRSLRFGKLDEAVHFFDFNVAVYPPSAHVYSGLGDAYLGKRDTIRAMEYFRKSMEINPQYTHAREQLQKLRK